ncbi:hypothetical protein R84B8_00644 [Treponema sp. R8-4-B8]
MSKHSEVKKRIEAVIKKAENGNIRSMRLLAFMYSRGKFFPKDYIAAEAWYRKAIELGSEASKKELAWLLTYGNGEAQDLDEAFEIYQELMMDFDTDAIVGIGIAYKFGLGVTKDEEKASYYLNLAFDMELGLMSDIEDVIIKM